MKNNKNRLKELREPTGLTQQDMSQMLGIARSTYTGYETGKIEIPLDKLQKLADHFNVTLDYLVGNNNKFFAWNFPLTLHHAIKHRREESGISIAAFAAHLNVTKEEITALEKGLLYPASSEVIAQIKDILKLEDSDLYSSNDSTANCSATELEQLVKERNYHLRMVQIIYTEYEEKNHYIIDADGEDIPEIISPAQQAKEYLLRQLEILPFNELTELLKQSYSNKINILADKIS